MQYTERLGLKKPDQDDAYQVDDFNYNYQKISEKLAGVPVSTTYNTLEKFIESGEADGLKRGDTVLIDNIIYIMNGTNPLLETSYVPYGAESIVVMNNENYVSIANRIRQTMYFQVTRTRGLIVRVFKKFFDNLFKITASTTAINGVAFAVMNGDVNVVGLAEADTTFTLGTVTLSAGKELELRGCPAGGSSSTYHLLATPDNGDAAIMDVGSGASYTPSSSTTVTMAIVVKSGTTIVSNTIFNPRITVTDGYGTDTYTIYFKETETQTENTDDGNNYRFTCKNASILVDGETPARVEGKIYLVADAEE